MRRILFAFALLLPAACAAAPLRAEVEKLLAGYEPRAKAADFKRLGPGTDAVLVEIASDPKAPGVRRWRALQALGFVPSEAGRAHCSRVVREQAKFTEGGEVLEVGACAEVLGVFGEKSAPELLPLLSHASSDVRLGAARGLETSRAALAEAPLQKRLAVEPDETVRAAIQSALRVMPPRK